MVGFITDCFHCFSPVLIDWVAIHFVGHLLGFKISISSWGGNRSLDLEALIVFLAKWKSLVSDFGFFSIYEWRCHRLSWDWFQSFWVLEFWLLRHRVYSSLAVPIWCITSFLCPFESHDLNHLIHPSIFIHKFSQSPFFPSKGNPILISIIGWPKILWLTFLCAHNRTIFFLTKWYRCYFSLICCIFLVIYLICEMGFIMSIYIPIFGCQRMWSLHMIRWFLANAISLFWKASNPNIIPKCSTIIDYFENMGITFHFIDNAWTELIFIFIDKLAIKFGILILNYGGGDRQILAVNASN